MKRADAPSRPIEADLISYTIIHGQDKSTLWRRAMDEATLWRRAMDETTLMIKEAAATTTEKLTWWG